MRFKHNKKLNITQKLNHPKKIQVYKLKLRYRIKFKNSWPEAKSYHGENWLVATKQYQNFPKFG